MILDFLKSFLLLGHSFADVNQKGLHVSYTPRNIRFRIFYFSARYIKFRTVVRKKVILNQLYDTTFYRLLNSLHKA